MPVLNAQTSSVKKIAAGAYAIIFLAVGLIGACHLIPAQAGAANAAVPIFLWPDVPPQLVAFATGGRAVFAQAQVRHARFAADFRPSYARPVWHTAP